MVRMNTLGRYLELIVDPTFDDFHANRGSIRRAFLACVAIYHSVDCVAETEGKTAAHFRQVWGKTLWNSSWWMLSLTTSSM